MDAVADLPGKIDEQRGQVVAVQVKSDGVGAVGIDGQLDRRGAAAVAEPFGLVDEAHVE